MTYNLVENYYGGGGGGECDFTATAGGTNYYFGGKLIKNAGGYVYPDRLGSIGKFYPYGIERPSATTNGKEKFTGYFRDADTGNDYAINRYMTPGMGRFITPDPSKGSHADPANPGSWNLYAYTHGDPINSSDPTGLCPLESGGDGDDSSCGDSGVTAQECEMYNIDPDPNFCEAIISAGIGESSGGGGDGSASSAPSPTDPAPGPQCDVTISPNGTYQCTATGSPTTNSIVDDPHGSQVSSQSSSVSLTSGAGGSSPQYNTCSEKAILSGIFHIGIDFIGLIPEAEGFTKVFENEAGYQIARAVGNSAGYRGVVATQYGMKVVKQGKGAVGAIGGAFGLGDTSVQGRISTGLTVVGFIPVLGTLAAGASIVNDAIKTGMDVVRCR